MLLAIGIILFVVGCLIDSVEDSSYRSERNAERRHRELMEQLKNERKNEYLPRKTRQTRRRFAVDREGNLLGEEITEEEIDDDC